MGSEMCIRDRSWGLFRDASDARHYIEYFVDENWVEHQRRMIRFSAHDAELRELRRSFHLGQEWPEVKRYVAQGAMRSGGGLY